MNQLPIDFDICSRKHQGNPESVAAWNRRDRKNDRAAVLNVIVKFGPLTSKEIARLLLKPLNAVSGRCSELKASGHIVKTGIVRDGAAELRVK